MFTHLDKMDAGKCMRSCIYFCFLLVSMVSVVTAMPTRDKQITPLKCLSMGKTQLKLCIDGSENPSRDIGPSWDFQIQKKHWNNILTPRTTLDLPPSYNRRMLTDYGGMVVPFFMKRSSRLQSSVPFQSTLSKIMENNMDGSSQSVNKRPFDSISYSTGLGGFK